MQTTKPPNYVRRLNNLRGYTFIKSETVALPGMPENTSIGYSWHFGTFSLPFNC